MLSRLRRDKRTVPFFPRRTYRVARARHRPAQPGTACHDDAANRRDNPQAPVTDSLIPVSSCSVWVFVIIIFFYFAFAFAVISGPLCPGEKENAAHGARRGSGSRQTEDAIKTCLPFLLQQFFFPPDFSCSVHLKGKPVLSRWSGSQGG